MRSIRKKYSNNSRKRNSRKNNSRKRNSRRNSKKRYSRRNTRRKLKGGMDSSENYSISNSSKDYKINLDMNQLFLHLLNINKEIYKLSRYSESNAIIEGTPENILNQGLLKSLSAVRNA
tara:strand:- start:66 stop:422 length:357 start_codon:yes stop_codon:yes gene_type:complete